MSWNHIPTEASEYAKNQTLFIKIQIAYPTGIFKSSYTPYTPFMPNYPKDRKTIHSVNITFSPPQSTILQ